MTPCGIVLGTRSRANRRGSGTRMGIGASANTREDQVDPVEPLNPSWIAPWPESPKGTVGRTSATGCFFAAFESGGGRASTRRTATLGTTRTIAARTSAGLDEYVSVTRRTATACTCLHRCDSGTRPVGRAHIGRTSALAGVATERGERRAMTAGPSSGMIAIVEPAARGWKLTSAAAATAASALVAATAEGASGCSVAASAAGSSMIRTIVTGGGADDTGSAAGWGAGSAGVGAEGAAGAASSSLTTSVGAGAGAGSLAAGAPAEPVASEAGGALSGVDPVSVDVAGGAGSGAAGGSCGAGSGSVGAGAGAVAVVSAGGVVVAVLSAGGSAVASAGGGGDASAA